MWVGFFARRRSLARCPTIWGTRKNTIVWTREGRKSLICAESHTWNLINRKRAVSRRRQPPPSCFILNVWKRMHYRNMHLWVGRNGLEKKVIKQGSVSRVFPGTEHEKYWKKAVIVDLPSSCSLFWPRRQSILESQPRNCFLKNWFDAHDDFFRESVHLLNTTYHHTHLRFRCSIFSG